MSIPITKKRKFVAEGIFNAELYEYLRLELAVDGFSGLEIRTTPPTTEITILATRTATLLGEKAKKLEELSSLIQKRWRFPPNSVRILAARLPNRALSAVAQVESMVYRIGGGLPVRRAAYGVLRFVMENGGRGVEVRVSGKLRGQRGKTMKFRDGYMIKSGDPNKRMVSTAVRHMLLEQGCLGVCVKIMLPTKRQHENGQDYIQPDVVEILQPKPDELARPERKYERISF